MALPRTTRHSHGPGSGSGLESSGRAGGCRRRPMVHQSWFPALLILAVIGDRDSESSRPYGLSDRPVAREFLDMPPDEHGAIPSLLSRTGAFRDTRGLSPGSALIPYDLNAPFWSDGAAKRRWISVPRGAV